MANNYTQFSMGITFEKKARKWLEKQLTLPKRCKWGVSTGSGLR